MIMTKRGCSCLPPNSRTWNGSLHQNLGKSTTNSAFLLLPLFLFFKILDCSCPLSRRAGLYGLHGCSLNDQYHLYLRYTMRLLMMMVRLDGDIRLRMSHKETSQTIKYCLKLLEKCSTIIYKCCKEVETCFIIYLVILINIGSLREEEQSPTHYGGIPTII